MAELINSRVESREVYPSYSIGQVLLLGFLMGLLNWGLAFLINIYINSAAVSGNIATIITATIATLIMLGFRIARPLIITMASASALWGVITLTDGLIWYESALWVVGLYALAYLLFSWIARYLKIVPVMIVIITITIIIRIVITL